jgi:hypothetical protein
VLTNNRPVYLERSLRAFVEHVQPHPVETVVMDDGGATQGLSELLAAVLPWPWRTERSHPSLGQCRAQGMLWRAARDSGPEWSFHLEDDQVIVRPVDLTDLRSVMEAHPHIAQMTLVRTPWGVEVEHGGYITQDPGWYSRHHVAHLQWIETTRNWANAPTLVRTSLMREFDFPDAQCETTIGPNIRAVYPDATFGLWGWGESWCSHIGIERGSSAHGY